MTPQYTIARGNPTPEEVAVAVAVLQAAGSAAAAAATDTTTRTQQRRAWSSPVHAFRPHAHHRGSGMWALSPRMR